MKSLPQSVHPHLADTDSSFWTPVADSFDWKSLDLTKSYVVSGSSFIDPADPYGPMGNPFAVVIGNNVKDMPAEHCVRISKRTRTSETIFVRDCHETNSDHYELLLTVLTPIGKELGACAYGFIGAIQTLLSCGRLKPNSEVNLRTTLPTSARVFISDKGAIALEFEVQASGTLQVASQTLRDIFQIEVITKATELPVLSVGAPKLVVELSPATFNAVQRKLGKLDYDKLLAFQDKEHLIGIHLFCRDQAGLPEKAIQVNAYLGRDAAADPATGVSAAAQIGADSNVPEGQEVTITQYTAKGPSGMLKVAKQAGTMRVRGAAVLFNYRLGV